MELEWKTCTVGMLETPPEIMAENPFDLDIQLPDYMPDIHRILHCTVTPQIQSVSAAADRVSAEGVGLVRMIYCSEDGNMHAYEQTFPVRRTLSESVSDAGVRVFAGTDYVNCRAAGQRRAAVNGSASIRFVPVRRQEYSFPTVSTSDGLQTKTKQVPIFSLSACTEKTFAMSEVAELNDTPPIGGIINSHTYVRVDTTKAIQDKILVKGEAVTDVRYFAASDGKSIISFSHTMPVNQVIEATGVTENDVQDVSLRVLSAMIIPKADSSGENRLLEITLQIAASVRCYANISPDFVIDAYSTTANLNPRFRETEMITDCVRWQENIRIRQKTDASGADLQSISLVCAERIQSTCAVRDGLLVVQCTMQLGLLGQNSEGSMIWTEKTVDFVCRKQLNEVDTTVVCTPTVCITQCTASLSADGSLDVQADGFLDCMVYTLAQMRIVASAETSPVSPDRDPAALTIYFADEGEQLWDIARKYCTTVDAVSAENDLTDDVMAEKRMLVIPLAN